MHPSSTIVRVRSRVLFGRALQHCPWDLPWYLWLAQDINRALVLSAGMPAESELNAHRMDCGFEKYKERRVVYVENMAVLGLQTKTVGKRMANIKTILNDRELLTHEHVPAGTDCELLGLRADGKRMELRMSSRRLEWAL